MSYCDLKEGPWCKKLREWAKKEVEENGLVDIKFFPLRIQLPGMPEPISCLRPGEKEPTLEELAEVYYKLLTSTDYEDITEENL